MSQVRRKGISGTCAQLAWASEKAELWMTKAP